MTLRRHGRYDVIATTDGRPVPPRVRISLAPFGRGLAGDYDPALIFTDGSVALYTEQFDVFPVASVAAAAALPADLGESEVAAVATRATFRDRGGTVRLAGRNMRAATIVDDEGAYVLFDSVPSVETESLSLVLDPELPRWIGPEIVRAMPPILARYEAEMGPRPGPKPMIIASWAGPTPGLSSSGGSTLPALVVMRFEGAGMVNGSRQSVLPTLWFIAHEAAHFWLGQAVMYQSPGDSWITEGGANLLAMRSVAAVEADYDWRAAAQREIDNCVQFSRGRGIAGALERNEFQAYYGCGTVFALVAESASAQPFTRFVRRLIEGSRDDRTVTRQEWLDTLDVVSRNPGLSRDIRRMVENGATDPAAAIASLFARAGVRHRVDNGRVLIR